MRFSSSHASGPQSMTTAAWQHLEQLARREGLGDAELAGLAIGCPWHGNASMDFDEAGVFCHRCESAAIAEVRPVPVEERSAEYQAAYAEAGRLLDEHPEIMEHLNARAAAGDKITNLPGATS